MTPAELTVLKMALNGHGVLWIAQAAQQPTGAVAATLAEHGGDATGWRQAVAAYERQAPAVPQRYAAPEQPRRVDLRDQPTVRHLAAVPLPPEPTVTAEPVHDPRCGSLLTGGGAPRGWVLVRVIGTGTPRRYCCREHAVDDLLLPAEAESSPNLRRTEPTKRRGNPSPSNPATALRQRLTDLGLDALTVRTWALSNGVITSTQGLLPGRAIDAYLTAHTNGAAS